MVIKHCFLWVSILLVQQLVFAQQQPVTVADLTIKIMGLTTRTLYYGFAPGDQIVFSCSAIDGKTLKRVEIIALPNAPQFSDFKTRDISRQTIAVYRKGVYAFRFTNTALKGRVFRVQIRRIPATPEQVAFNTDWKWETRYDTTYTSYTEDSLVGHDTTYVPKTQKVLVAVDTTITELFNKMERVHSETAIGKTPYAYLNVYLPTNRYSPNRFNPYQSTEVMAWSYWLGVGQKSVEDYQRINKQWSSGLTSLGMLTGYGALASLAVTGINLFGTPTVGDNVRYAFVTVQNGVERRFDFGNGTTASGRNTELLQGGFTIELQNDNFRDGIDVNVRLICVQLHKTWKDKVYHEPVVTPRYSTLHKKRRHIQTRKVRVNVE